MDHQERIAEIEARLEAEVFAPHLAVDVRYLLDRVRGSESAWTGLRSQVDSLFYTSNNVEFWGYVRDLIDEKMGEQS